MSEGQSITRREAVTILGGALAASGLAGGASADAHSADDPASVDYAMQKNFPGLKVPETVTVVGTGRYGAWVGMFAAIAGVKKLYLMDMGSVEADDLPGTPFTVKQIGQPKVAALKELINALRPEATVETFHKPFVEKDDADKLFGIVFHCSNSLELHKIVPALAKKRDLKYFTGGYNGLNIGVADRELSTIRIAPGDTPVWVGTAVLTAILTVHSAFIDPFIFVGPVHELSPLRPEKLARERFEAAFGAVSLHA